MGRINSKFEASVIIPTYNRRELLDFSLQSLDRQDIGKNKFEVIVADDGSNDNTLEIVKKYEQKMNIKYVYQPDKGYRPASARNMGIRSAEGDICIFIDSGVLLNDNCVRKHIDFYAQVNDRVAAIGYVYGFERTKDSEEQLMQLVDPYEAAQSIATIRTDEIFFDIREEHYVKYNDEIHNLPAPWYYFWTCHVSVPWNELMKVGLFDEKYDGRWGVEDNDLAFRLLQQGVKIHLLKGAEAIHYPHAKDKGERRMEGYHNCLYFNTKFSTVETRIFRDNYLFHTEFVDINKLSMDMRTNEEYTPGELVYDENKLVKQD